MMLYGKHELAYHFVKFLFNSKNKSLRKKGKKSHICDKHQTYSFLSTYAKRQMAEMEFLLFAGKTNVMPNLSNDLFCT